MDNQPSFDRGILIPILIGGFSVVGIIAVLLIGRSLNSPAAVAVSPSSTPFQSIFLGTEPYITTPLAEFSEISSPTEEATPAFIAPTSPSASTPLILTQPNMTNTTGAVFRTNTPGGPLTSTVTSSTAVTSVIYDDTDSRLAYSGNWVSQTNVTGAHEGTLHISNTIGDFVTFTFTGQEIHLYYQAGPSLGTVTLTIDGVGPPPLDQSQNETQIKEWVSNTLSQGTHSIIITHYGGGSVNIDSLIVPASTPASNRTATPTLTPTVTATQ
jgi:hypothetical protein